jgi:5-carboxymethyl-2-hydroxymuconate isomerase
MPHFVIECSKGVLEKVDSEEILREVYDTAVSSNLFDKEGVGGIKVRLRVYEDYLTVGTKDEFIHVFGNIMEGRTIEQKSMLSRLIVTSLKKMFEDVLIISMNVQEFERASYTNRAMIK